MKKILALLLLAVMCFPLLACGENDNAALVKELESRIAQLEATLAEREAEIARLLAEGESVKPENPVPEDTKPENTVPEDTKPENTEPQYETVEITPDNWQEYFEIIGYMEYRDNAFGEAESCFFRSELRLKEEYRSRLSANMMMIKVLLNFRTLLAKE